MIFTAEVALMPNVTKLADYEKLHIEKKPTEPTKELIAQATADLVRMQTKETRSNPGTALQKGDKAVVNLIMKKGGVVLEGGEGQDHGIYTAETYYIEGFIEKILGMKEGETREFTLPFPKDHFQKHVAGQPVDFTIELKEIFNLGAPNMDDAFAKTLGFKDLPELEARLRENLLAENIHEESVRQDKEILELVATKSDFEEIPDLLVNQEIEQMIAELKHSLENKGLDFDEYLKQINKTYADIKLDMAAGALTRVKVTLILKAVAKKENVRVDEKKVDLELDKIADKYEDKDTKEKIYSPEYRDYLEHQIRNRQTIDLLKGKMLK